MVQPLVVSYWLVVVVGLVSPSHPSSSRMFVSKILEGDGSRLLDPGNVSLGF